MRRNTCRSAAPSGSIRPVGVDERQEEARHRARPDGAGSAGSIGDEEPLRGLHPPELPRSADPRMCRADQPARAGAKRPDQRGRRSQRSHPAVRRRFSDATSFPERHTGRCAKRAREGAGGWGTGRYLRGETGTAGPLLHHSSVEESGSGRVPIVRHATGPSRRPVRATAVGAEPSGSRSWRAIQAVTAERR